MFHRRELSGVLSLCRTTIRRPAHAEEIAPGGQFTCIGAGRTFEVILARGQEVSAEDQDAAWAMLNSFIPVAIESAP